ncbi:MAG TPA: hypothetical protein DCP91_06430, partial [Eggerthellaceae bacterium]|nr:hypothetical protein [Eggerthellaceae bacterium]
MGPGVDKSRAEAAAPVAGGADDAQVPAKLTRAQKRALKKDPFAVAGVREDDEFASEALAAERAFNKKVPLWAKLAIVAAFVVVFFASFMLGRYGLTPVEWFYGVYDHVMHAIDPAWPYFSQETDNVLFQIRFPRIIVVLLSGAALAVAGASYQGMFKN